MDFRNAGSISELLRLLQELIISGLDAAGLYTAGQLLLGILTAINSVIHHMLHETLIKS